MAFEIKKMATNTTVQEGHETEIVSNCMKYLNYKHKQRVRVYSVCFATKRHLQVACQLTYTLPLPASMDPPVHFDIRDHTDFNSSYVSLLKINSDQKSGHNCFIEHQYVCLQS